MAAASMIYQEKKQRAGPCEEKEMENEQKIDMIFSWKGRKLLISIHYGKVKF